MLHVTLSSIEKANSSHCIGVNTDKIRIEVYILKI